MNDEEFGDIAPLVHAAARTVAPYPQDLRQVRRQGTLRRRRRMIGASLAAAAVTVATVVTVSTALPRATTAPGETVQAIPSVSPSMPAMAQVLSINATGYETTNGSSGGATGVMVLPGIMFADGSFKDYPGVPGVTPQELVPGPGGGWVVRGLVDLTPGVSREDGPCVSGISTPLIVLDPDGTQLSSREIHRQCHPAYLVGVHAGRAFLQRDNNFVTIDLATGTESVFALLGSSLPARSGVEAGVLYSLTEQAGQCPKLTLRTIDLATGADTSREISQPVCGFNPDQIRLSPDGRRIAFTYPALIGDRSTATSVVIADTETGQVVSSQVLPRSPSSRMPTLVGGMAWVDMDTVRVAFAVQPGQGVHDFRTIVQTVDVS